MQKLQILETIAPPEKGWRKWWRDFCNFMIDKSIAPAEPLAEYDRKARFYPYLPAIEEQRDWLEKIYTRSRN